MSRTVVVTGGSSGIGLGVTRRFAAAGHRVAVIDIQADAVGRVSEELGVLGQVADVTDRAAVDAAFAAARAEYGPVEVLVTSAGIDAEDDFLTMSVERWERVLTVNLTGTFHCVQVGARDMADGGWGRIVMISSTSAQTGAPGRAHYVASKGGVIALTKALAMDLAKHGITVNTIPPSIIDTPMLRTAEAEGRMDVGIVAAMTMVGRIGTPDDVAAAAEFLCSDDAGFITGQQIGVNGGWHL